MELEKNNLTINQIVAQKLDTAICEGDCIVPDIKPDIFSIITSSGIVNIYKKEVSDKAKDKFDTEVNDGALQVKNAIDDTQASQPVKPKMDEVSEIMLLLEKSSPGSVTGIVDSQKTQQVSYGERVNEIDSSLF